MFIKMNKNGTMGCSPKVESGKIPPGWESEIFELIHIYDECYGMWNPTWKMFIKMNRNATMGCSPIVESGMFPSGWESEIFKLIHIYDDCYAMWNPTWKMFIKMNRNGTMECSPIVENGVFPRGWESEIFNLTILNGYKRKKSSFPEVEGFVKHVLVDRVNENIKEKKTGAFIYTEETAKEKQKREEEKKKLKEQEKALKLEEKAREKQMIEEEKKKAKEEEMLKHKLKSSRGECYCVFCGKHDHKMYGNEICLGRENGHSFVFMKDKNDRWKLKCNKCGKRDFESREGCL
jgi:hypothetical protein